MRLILTLTGGGSSVPDKDKRRTLSAGSLSIGRGPGNDWVLPDPERSLSKTHCAVTAEGGRFILTDLSTNGLYVNGATQATERDSRIVLTDGDDFRLGDYGITVALAEDHAAASGGYEPPSAYRPAADPFGAGDPFGSGPVGGREGSGPLDVDPLDDPFGRPPNPAFQHPIAAPPVSLRGADPFDAEPARPARTLADDDDLFRGMKPSGDWQGAPRHDHASAMAQNIPPPRVVPMAPGDIDFDALIGDLKMPGGGPASPPAAPQYHPAARPGPGATPPRDFDPFADADPMLKAAPTRPTRIDDPDPFGEPPAPPVAAPPMAAPVAPPRPPAAPAPDPFADAPSPDPFAEEPAPRRAAPPPEPVAPPPRPAPQAAPQAPAAPVAAAAPAADSRALLVAFLEGAGVAPERVDASDPEAALRAAGRIFRAMAEGVREVLISRAAIKSEMRLEQTMIAAHGNNALKFSVTADDAVAALLTPKRPGYMDPLAATKEAFNDVKSHEIAVMAGVQTALFGLLKRFDPEELEKRMTTTGLASVLPGARKARYWDSFRQVYGDISHEAEDDFQAVFGRNFAKAYSAQTRKE